MFLIYACFHYPRSQNCLHFAHISDLVFRFPFLSFSALRMCVFSAVQRRHVFLPSVYGEDFSRMCHLMLNSMFFSFSSQICDASLVLCRLSMFLNEVVWL